MKRVLSYMIENMFKQINITYNLIYKYFMEKRMR